MKYKLIRRFLLLSIITLSLASCHQRVNKNATYININGDTVYGEKYENLNEAITYEPVDSLIAKAKKGIDTYVFTTSSECFHCEKMEPIYLETLNKDNQKIYTFQKTEDVSNEEFNTFCDSLNKEFKTNDGGLVIDKANPRLYHFLNKEGFYFDMYEDNNTYDKFSSYLEYETIKTNIYEFSNIKAFEKAMKENSESLVYLFNYKDELNLDFYADIYNKFAKASSKKMLLLNYHSLSESDKTNFQNTFTSFDTNGCIKIGKKILPTNEENSDSIKEMIDNYYIRK